VSSYLAFSPLPYKIGLTAFLWGGIFSVALSLGSPPVAVSDHPALWSPDFPPAFGRRSPDPLPHLELHRSKGEKGEFYPISPLTPFIELLSYFLIYGFVSQLICPAIFFPGHMMNIIFGKSIQNLEGLTVQGFKVCFTYSVFPSKLPNHEL
jgi:hypothetical protein